MSMILATCDRSIEVVSLSGSYLSPYSSLFRIFSDSGILRAVATGEYVPCLSAGDYKQLKIRFHVKHCLSVPSICFT